MIAPATLFHYPEALVLALPAVLAWWWLGRGGRGSILRLIVLLVLVLAAAGPELSWRRGGSDVVVLLDRSDSIPAADRAAQQELLALVGEQRGRDDRLAVIAFGDGQQVVQAPDPAAVPQLLDPPFPTGATDLAGALELAAGVVAPGRSARVLLHSDGEHTGRDPRAAASALAWRDIPLDVLPVLLPPAADAAIVDLELPGSLRLGESFIGAVRLVSDRRETRAWRVLRGEREIAAGAAELLPGRALTVTFADRPVTAGLAAYRVELDPSEDRRVLNNTARGATRVIGGERVLVMGGDGERGNLAAAIEAAGLVVDTVAEGPIGLDRLLAYRVVVLEQVPASALGHAGMQALAHWVERLGGGLVMTGGRRSFGSGGWHRSPVERVLPVTMELRDEHRKLSVALAMCLDRSGSMAMPVPGGQTKMDLANAGAAAAVELLSPLDQVAVVAVDSAPHVVVDLTAVTDGAAIAERIRRIESMGGGIFVYEALVEGGRQLLRSNKGTRHLVLFADAQDSEQPGAYRDLLADYRAAGITVSVIGLGSEHDVDAGLLKDIAARGGGRITFSDQPAELPRLFAQETVLVARSAWVDGPVALEHRPDLGAVLGPHPAYGSGWPAVAGYNLTYARDRSQVLVQAPGDPAGPAVAVWRIGTGRSAAITLDLDDPEDPRLLGWPGYAPLVTGIVRWCAGSDETVPAALGAERAGRDVTLRLEMDPARRAEWPDRLTTLDLVDESGRSDLVPLHSAGDGVWQARLRLADERSRLPSVALPTPGGERAVLGPPLQLLYSPEAEPRYGRRPGRELLGGLATLGGGTLRSDVVGVFDNPPSPGQATALAPWLLALVVLLVVGEVAVRRLRLRLWPGRERAQGVGAGAPAAVPAAASASTAVTPKDQAPPSPPPPPEAGSGGLHEALRQLKQRR